MQYESSLIVKIRPFAGQMSVSAPAFEMLFMPELNSNIVMIGGSLVNLKINFRRFTVLKR